MNQPFATCEGRNCPSKTNCRRFTERSTVEAVPAALWIRREAGASACDMYLPIEVVSTFQSDEQRQFPTTERQ